MSTYLHTIISFCQGALVTRLTDRRTDRQTDVDSKVRSNEVRCAQKSRCRYIAHCDRYHACDIAVRSISEKNWRYGFEQTKELPACHTVPHSPTSSPAQEHRIGGVKEIDVGTCGLHTVARTEIVACIECAMLHARIHNSELEQNSKFQHVSCVTSFSSFLPLDVR